MADAVQPDGPGPTTDLDPDGKILKRFNSMLADADTAHAPRIELWRAMDRAYSGTVRADREGRDGAQGTSRGRPDGKQVFPKYALGVVETIKAGIDDDMPQIKLTPTVVDAERIAGAKCLEHLITWQRKKLHYDTQRSLFIDQALRRGASIGKVPWVYETQITQQRTFAPGPVGMDNPLGKSIHTGYTQPLEKVTKQGAGFRAIDVIQCPWDPGAEGWDDVTHLFYKTYVTLDELERMRDLGVYSWPEDCTPVKGAVDDPTVRNRSLKNRIQVIERWELTARGCWLTVVANKNLVIRDCVTPLKHGKIPFVFASTNPGMFIVDGMSEVELVMEEQAAIWELLNQSLINAKYQNNYTYFLDESLKDAANITFGPGAVNYINAGGNVDRMVKTFQPTQTLQFAQPLIEMLITEMNAISPANPYMSGASSQDQVNETATGINLIQNMAQKRVQRKKEEILKAIREVGLQQVALNQQLLPAAVVIAVEDSAQPKGYQQVTVDPAQIQGEYDYDATDVADSVSQMQRKQEAQNMVTTLLQIQQVAATIPPGVPPLVNFTALVETFTEANDEKPDKFLAGAPQEIGSQPLPAPPAIPGPLPILGGNGPTPPPGAPGPSPIPAAGGNVFPLPPRSN